MIKLPVKISKINYSCTVIEDATGETVMAIYGESAQNPNSHENRAKALVTLLNNQNASQPDLERTKAILKADLETIRFTLNRTWETLVKLNGNTPL